LIKISVFNPTGLFTIRKVDSGYSWHAVFFLFFLFFIFFFFDVSTSASDKYSELQQNQLI